MNSTSPIAPGSDRLALVTGASGYVGGQLLARLERRGLWLEFEVTPCERGSRIHQTAVFDPCGLSGLLYWYAVSPLHALVFRGLLAGIARAARGDRSRRSIATRRRIAASLLTLLFLSGAPAQASELARADALWARRADGHAGAVARPEPIRAAIEAYERAITAAPDELEARWKLLRALWFAAEFVDADVTEKRRTHERAQDVSERAFELLAERAGARASFDELAPETLRDRLSAADRRDGAELYFWHAVHLGAWSRLAGLLEAVRAGVAGRIHDATLRSIALDPDVERGGAIRLLSHLHAELPRVPLLSGWVDRSQALPLAERALSEYPDHPGNAYVMGLTILSNAPDRSSEALALIEGTANLEPRPDHVVEDLAIRIDARERLDGRDTQRM